MLIAPRGGGLNVATIDNLACLVEVHQFAAPVWILLHAHAMFGIVLAVVNRPPRREMRPGRAAIISADEANQIIEAIW